MHFRNFPHLDHDNLLSRPKHQILRAVFLSKANVFLMRCGCFSLALALALTLARSWVKHLCRVGHKALWTVSPLPRFTTRSRCQCGDCAFLGTIFSQRLKTHHHVASTTCGLSKHMRRRQHDKQKRLMRVCEVHWCDIACSTLN